MRGLGGKRRAPRDAGAHEPLRLPLHPGRDPAVEAGLVAEPAAARACLAGLERGGASVASVLRRVRRRLGLHQAEVARRLGIGVATVNECERGCSPRHATLMRYLERLPGLTPAGLLGRRDDGRPVASPSAWAFHRELHGFVPGAA